MKTVRLSTILLFSLMFGILSGCGDRGGINAPPSAVAVAGSNRAELEADISAAHIAKKMVRYITIRTLVGSDDYSVYAQIVHSDEAILAREYGHIYVYPLSTSQIFYSALPSRPIDIASIPLVRTPDLDESLRVGNRLNAASGAWSRLCSACSTVIVHHGEPSGSAFWASDKDQWQINPDYAFWKPGMTQQNVNPQFILQPVPVGGGGSGSGGCQPSLGSGFVGSNGTGGCSSVGCLDCFGGKPSPTPPPSCAANSSAVAKIEHTNPASKSDKGPITLPANFSAHPTHVAAVPDSQIDQHIGPELSQHDHNVIYSVMKQLPPEDRNNVMFFDQDGKNYANSSTMLRYMERWQGIGENRYEKPNGEIVNGPVDLTPDEFEAVKTGDSALRHPTALGIPAFPTTTGAGRRVYSSPGYSRVFSDVFLSCGTNLTAGASSTGFIYEGGFGAVSDQMDAGLQYSAVHATYSVFIKDAAEVNLSGTNQINASGLPFVCGQTVSMTFEALGSTAMVTVEGTTTNGSVSSITAVTPLPTAATEWPASGCGVQVKRMTTIGQSTTQLSDGFTFGYSPVNGAPLIAWSGSEVGNSNIGWISWVNGNGGVQSEPSDPSKIVVNYINQGAETDGIFLHP